MSAFLSSFLFIKIAQSVWFRTELLFIYHGYSLCRAYLRAYSTPFAVLKAYPDGYGFADESIRAIEPAHKAGWLFSLGRGALFLVYHRARAAPFACPPPFANTR